MTIEQMLSQENDPEYVTLREANNSLSKQLEKEKQRTTELMAAAYRAARDAMASLVLPTVPAPQKPAQPPLKGRKHAEVCIPLLSDLQLGKLTSSYNSKVCEERVAFYAEKIVELANIHRTSVPVTKCHVVMLGDMVEGETIFAGQSWLLDASLFRQSMVDGPRILINFLMTLLANFDFVEVTMVDGNHGIEGGQKSGKHHPETNSDRMLYNVVKMIFEHNPTVAKRIKLNLACDKHESEKNWYAIVREGEYSALAIHGYEVKGNGPWHGLTLAKKVNGWAAGAIPEPFIDVFMGHYHSLGIIPLNHRKVYCTGSTESDNDFARQLLSAVSEPKHWTLFASPTKGRITANYDVYLK